MNFEYLLEGFPEWAIPMTKVVPIFYTEDGIDLNDPDKTLTVVWDYWWEVVDGTNARIHIDIQTATLKDESIFTLFI